MIESDSRKMFETQGRSDEHERTAAIFLQMWIPCSLIGHKEVKVLRFAEQCIDNCIYKFVVFDKNSFAL